MTSTPNSNCPQAYPSYHGNFEEQNGSEWMTLNYEAHQHTTIAGPQDLVSRLLEDLMTVTAHMDAKFRELQDLNHKKQDMMARLTVLTTTTTPTWDIPLQPNTSTSSSTPPYAQTVAHPPLGYTPHNFAGESAFGSGYESSRAGRMTQTLEHAKKSHICHCGKGYTRKDSLLRHAAIHAHDTY